MPGAGGRNAARVRNLARAALLTVFAAVSAVAGARAEAPAGWPSFAQVSPDTVVLDLTAGDSLARPPVDEAPPRRLLAESDSIRKARLNRPRGRFEAPAWVMARSFVVPGWGQLHNRSWIKAIGVAGGEGWLIARMIGDERALRDLEDRIERAQAAADEPAYDTAIAAYNARLDQTVRRRWFFGALLAYALLDAYVDAHFVNFDIEFDDQPAGGPGEKAAPGARLGVRWSF